MCKFNFERELLHELNPKLKCGDFEILSILDEEYDLFGCSGFPDFLLEADLTDILSYMIMDKVPGRLILDDECNLERIAEYDLIGKQIVRTRECIGSYYVDEQINKMNELLKDGKED